MVERLLRLLTPDFLGQLKPSVRVSMTRAEVASTHIVTNTVTRNTANRKRARDSTELLP